MVNYDRVRFRAVPAQSKYYLQLIILAFQGKRTLTAPPGAY